MNDRNEYHQHEVTTRTEYRQHYDRANATKKPRVPTWVKVLVIVACIGLAGGLTGCGGGGSAADVPTVLASSAPVPMVEFFGDSTMVRCYAGQVGDAVAYAENTIGDKMANSAVSGSTSISVTPQRIAGSPATAVAMNWAINDSHDVPADTFRAQLTAQASAAVAAGKAVILIESTPIVPGGQWSAERSDADRLAFEVIKRDVAARTGAYYCAMPARAWTLTDKPDGIHEADAAASWKGSVIADCIRQAV